MFRRIAILSFAGLSTTGLYVYLRRDRNKDTLIDDPESVAWTPPSRTSLISRLKSEQFDVLVVGGGATGTGCALDAASRGLKTACVDAGDWSCCTSSRSTKLVHGGVRYLEKAVWELDWQQYKLVREALEERKTVLKIAPHLCGIVPIMVPIIGGGWWKAIYYYAGCKAYDLVAGREALEPSYWLSRSRALQAFPLLKKKGLMGAVVYHDGQQDDARMNVALALTAIRYGAAVANYMTVTGLLKDANGRLIGANVEDKITGEKFEIRAKGIINATGPYTDVVRQMDDKQATTLLHASAGVHVVLPKYYSPQGIGLIDPATKDGRVLFFLPWQENTLAGTTDAPAVISDKQPAAREEDIRYILDEVKGYLDERVPVRYNDVLSAWAGIRPLVRHPDVEHGKETASIVRSHVLIESPSGLLTITGGKWTTYRRMAEETIDRAVHMFNLVPRNKCQTRRIRLIGAQGYTDTLWITLIQQFGYETDVAQHLARSYGDRAIGIAMLDDGSDPHQRWPMTGKRLVAWYPWTEAEVRWAVRHEYAQGAVDVLARRIRLAFHSSRAALDALPRVCEIVGEELGWDAERIEEENDMAKRFLMEEMGLSIVAKRRTESSREQLEMMRAAFLQAGSNGWILREEAVRLLPNGHEDTLPDSKYISLGELLTTIHG